MLSDQDVQNLLENDRMSKGIAVPMLNAYVVQYDHWWEHIATLHKRLTKRYSKDEAARQLKDIVSFTILFPAYDRTVRIDTERPENNLFRWMKFDQRAKKDWYDELKSVVKFDHKVTSWRKQVLELGIIDPIDYQPLTRQAFNWLCERADNEGSLNEENREKFRLFVMAYGGASICYLFENHKAKVDKTVNWRSPYFIERLLYKTYDVEQVVAIKRKEFSKTKDEYIRTLES